ncbi:MAG: hypothetical protein KF861_24630, partial [Planctomycetaceae bacterium]|nr:hypothetical protein [Planctomycetaceae bacterium]
MPCDRDLWANARSLLWIVAVLWGGICPVRGDDVPTAIPRTGNYSESLSNLQDRSAEQELREAERELQSGDIAAGVARLQQLISREVDAFVLVDGVYRPVDEAAALVLASGSDNVRSTYERLFGSLAREELNKARQADDSESLRRVARQFRFTAAGRQAQLALAASAADRGAWEQAERWIRDAAAAAANARSSGGERWLARIAARSAVHAAEVVHEEAAVPDWLGAEASIELTRARWRRDVPMTNGARREMAASLSELNAQAIVPVMAAVPLVKGEVAFWRQLGSVAAVHLGTGDVLWEYPLPVPAAALLGENLDFGNTLLRIRSTAV